MKIQWPLLTLTFYPSLCPIFIWSLYNSAYGFTDHSLTTSYSTDMPGTAENGQWLGQTLDDSIRKSAILTRISTVLLKRFYPYIGRFQQHRPFSTILDMLAHLARFFAIFVSPSSFKLALKWCIYCDILKVPRKIKNDDKQCWGIYLVSTSFTVVSFLFEAFRYDEFSFLKLHEFSVFEEFLLCLFWLKFFLILKNSPGYG